MKKVTIFTDGGCRGNPGPGAWAVVLRYGEHKRKLSGGVIATTNNRMELQAAVEGLNALKEPCEVAFHTDSEYLRQGITSWVFGWKKNGWKTKAKQPVKNVDLWQALDLAAARHKVHWHWVKGHAGNSGNEQCDLLANKEIDRIEKQFTKAQRKAAVQAFTAAQKSPEASPALPGLQPQV